MRIQHVGFGDGVHELPNPLVCRDFESGHVGNLKACMLAEGIDLLIGRGLIKLL